MKYTVFFLCFAAFFLVSCGTKKATASLKAKLLNIKGTVLVLKSSGSETAQENMVLTTNDTVQTRKESSCDIRLSDGSMLMLDSETELNIAALSSEKEGTLWNIIVTAVKGSVFADVQKQENAFEIRSMNAVAGVRGTRFLFIADEQKKTTKILTVNGEIYCFNLQRSPNISRTYLLNLKNEREITDFYKQNNIFKVTESYEYFIDAQDKETLSQKSFLEYNFRGQRLNTFVESRKVHGSSDVIIDE